MRRFARTSQTHPTGKSFSLRTESLERRDLFAGDFGFTPDPEVPLPIEPPPVLPPVELVRIVDPAILLPLAPSASLDATGKLTVRGSIFDDKLEVRLSPNSPRVIEVDNLNNGYGADWSFNAAAVNSIHVQALGGNDMVRINDAFGLVGLGRSIQLEGGTGNDMLYGGATTDVILGGDGDDGIFGNGGNDILRGEAGQDRIFGGWATTRCPVGMATTTWTAEPVTTGFTAAAAMT